MECYSSLNAEISSIRGFALLNLLELDCADLNKEMSNHCLSLRNSLILWQVDMNRKWNRKICNQFDEMATKLGEIPEKTKDLVIMADAKNIPSIPRTYISWSSKIDQTEGH